MRKRKPAKKKRSLAKKPTGKKRPSPRKRSTRPAPASKDSSAVIHQGVGVAGIGARGRYAEQMHDEDVTSEYGGES
jgi:hypothetical protein